MARIDELVGELTQLPDAAVRTRVEELVGAVLELHGDALRRMLDLVAEQPDGGAALFGELGADELVRSVLLVHDLHPISFAMRVEQALESVRPIMHSHKGDVELLGIEDDVVRLRLKGSCEGCPSSELTMKAAVEKALYEAAPEIAGIEVEGLSPPPPGPPVIECLVPLQMASPRAGAASGPR
ncbi:MAG: NifU family protein [Candidatus Dormibacteraeota bacterium]|uniref:NifU family protein n=1 Tax=Candidatus Amunia macphersoniae TaxID=3127014 RepID=A0A934KN46_9BACT|nr:NifU family protein [Candidatus Dormibacteraeota bacterium]